jgi:hypothetical protein
MNSMGAKLNTVSLSLAGTESADMIDAAYECLVSALQKLYEPPPNGPKLCDDANCGFYSMFKHHNSGKWKAFLATDAGKAKQYEVKKPSSDNTKTFSGGRKENLVLPRRYISVEHMRQVRFHQFFIMALI